MEDTLRIGQEIENIFGCLDTAVYGRLPSELSDEVPKFCIYQVDRIEIVMARIRDATRKKHEITEPL